MLQMSLLVQVTENEIEQVLVKKSHKKDKYQQHGVFVLHDEWRETKCVIFNVMTERQLLRVKNPDDVKNTAS